MQVIVAPTGGRSMHEHWFIVNIFSGKRAYKSSKTTRDGYAHAKDSPVGGRTKMRNNKIHHELVFNTAFSRKAEKWSDRNSFDFCPKLQSEHRESNSEIDHL